MTTMMIILLNAVLAENIILTKLLGVCPFLGVSKKLNSAVGMGLAVTIVLILASLVTWPIYTLLLAKNGLEYMQTFIFILVIAALVKIGAAYIRKYDAALHASLGLYLPLMTTNCAILGVTILNIGNAYTLGESLVYALGAGGGFLLAMVMFAGVQSRIETCELPKSFKGFPATLISASIVSLSFIGFSGVAEGIFR